MTSATSKYREIGDTTLAHWQETIRNAGGPEALAHPAVWQAARPHSKLLLTLMRQESRYGTQSGRNRPMETLNPFSFRVPDYSNEDTVEGYLHFESWADAMLHAKDRIISGAYWAQLGKPDPYRSAESLADLLNVYAPPAYNDTDRLVREAVSDLNRMPDAEGGDTPMPDVETLKPHTISLPVTKQYDGQGFNYGTRSVVGLVPHETQGRGTGRFYQQFFSCPNGERCSNALVDWFIDRSGQLFEFQDPFTSNRVPWASGGTPNTSNPIGRAINAQYPNVNRYFAAVEMEKTDNEHLTGAQIDTLGRLAAYVMARCGYPADGWQYPAKLGGTIFTLPNHGDISQTTCRQYADDRAAFEAKCTASLRQFYGGTEPAPPPEPPPVEIFPGLDVALAAEFFGSVTGEDGKLYQFDPSGPWSKLWLEHGRQTGHWPEIQYVKAIGDGRRYGRFDGGFTIFDPAGKEPPRVLKP